MDLLGGMHYQLEAGDGGGFELLPVEDAFQKHRAGFPPRLPQREALVRAPISVACA